MKNHAHDHRHCKVYEADKKAYFAAHPDKKPKEQRIADWKAKGGDGGKGQGKGQGKGGGKGYGGGPRPDRRVRSIAEVAEDMLRTLEEPKAQQRGGQSLGGLQQEGAAAGQRKVYSDFSTVFLLLLLLAVGVGFPTACFGR